MQNKPTIRKERAELHTYGPDMARHGSVYVAYDGEKLVCYAATAGAARKLYAKALSRFYVQRKRTDGLVTNFGKD